MRQLEMSGKGKRRTCRVLFDHLVGAGDERRRHREAKRLGGLEIDNEFELCGLLDRQIGGLNSLENFVDKDRGALEVRGVVGRVRDQTSGPRSVTVARQSNKTVLCREPYHPCRIREEVPLDYHGLIR